MSQLLSFLAGFFSAGVTLGAAHFFGFSFNGFGAVRNAAHNAASKKPDAASSYAEDALSLAVVLHPRLIPPYAPMLHMDGLTDDEKQIARAIHQKLQALATAAKNISAAFALFQLCQEKFQQQLERHKQANDYSSIRNTLFTEWDLVAARSGAMSLHNYLEALSTLRSLIGRIPVWLTLVDTKSLKDAENAFKQAFPFATELRNAVGHPELYHDPKKDMTAPGPYAGPGLTIAAGAAVSIPEFLDNTTFIATWSGQVIRYDMVEATPMTVIKITCDCFAAFSRVDPFSPEFRTQGPAGRTGPK